MEYEIHGKIISHVKGECGIYKSSGIDVDYAVMDPNTLVATVNGMQRDEAIGAVRALRDKAEEQLSWENTPQNVGAPILVRRHSSTPIDVVRDKIRNTRDFANAILEMLEE